MDQADGDMEVDQCLIGKFSSMGTTDKDVLVSQFRSLVGGQLEYDTCVFFLEMSNWNLQAAIGAYYDYKTPQTVTPTMSFVRDVTIGEGESVPPDTGFLKTWRIQNNGNERWPCSCTLRFVNGDKLDSPDWVAVRALGPSEVTDVCVRMKSPAKPGIYQGQWRMFSQSMTPFGDVIWVIITVEAGGLLGVTQQMSQFASALGNNSSLSSPFQDSNRSGGGNPFSFGSPSQQHQTGNSSGGNATDMEMATVQQEQSGENNNSSLLMRCLEPSAAAPPPPSTSCWSERSPTSAVCPVELMMTRAHALTAIDEEENQTVAACNFISRSSYDLNASSSSSTHHYQQQQVCRQISPSGSPTRKRSIEQHLASPEAPSPIRPTPSAHHHQQDCCNIVAIRDKTLNSGAQQRLDFGS